MKKILLLLTVFNLFLSCEGPGSSPDLKLLASINDNSIERLKNKNMNLGTHIFMQSVMKEIQKSKLKRNEALVHGNWSEYVSALSSVVTELVKIRSFESDPFFESIDLALTTENKGSLLSIENYLISSVDEAFFNYFYQADILSASVDLPANVSSSIKPVPGEIRLHTSMSTLMTRANFDIIDTSTGKIEKHYELKSDYAGMLTFDYRSTDRGTKLVKGYLQIFSSRIPLEIPFEKEITVK